MDGFPAGVNPFSMNVDETINDGSMCSYAPDFFAWNEDDEMYCPSPSSRNTDCPQKEAEELVGGLLDADIIGSFAVKEPYAHIIPQDLREAIKVTRSHDGLCSSQDCYSLSS